MQLPLTCSLSAVQGVPGQACAQELVKKDMLEHDEQAGCALFFARCPPALPPEDLLQLFSKYGEVKTLNLYRRWAKAKNSKGCGTVVFADRKSAEAAVLALNGTHEWPESDAKMVVEWFDSTQGKIPCTDKQTVVMQKATGKQKAFNKQRSPPHQYTPRHCVQHTMQQMGTAIHQCPVVTVNGNDMQMNYSVAFKQSIHSAVPVHLASMTNTSPSAHNSTTAVHAFSHIPLQMNQNNWAAAPNSILQDLPASSALHLLTDHNGVAAALSSLHSGSRSNSFASSQSFDSVCSLQDLTMAATTPTSAEAWQTLQGITGPCTGNSIWNQDKNNHQTFAAVAPPLFASGMASSSMSGVSTTAIASPSCSAALTGVMDNTPTASVVNNALGGINCSTPVESAYARGPADQAGGLENAATLLQLQQQQAATMAQLLAAALSSRPLLTEAHAGVAAVTVPTIEEMRLPLNLQALNKVAGFLGDISQATGANVSIDACAGGLQLRLRGSATQINGAWQLLCAFLLEREIV